MYVAVLNDRTEEIPRGAKLLRAYLRNEGYEPTHLTGNLIYFNGRNYVCAHCAKSLVGNDERSFNEVYLIPKSVQKELQIKIDNKRNMIVLCDDCTKIKRGNMVASSWYSALDDFTRSKIDELYLEVAGTSNLAEAV